MFVVRKDIPISKNVDISKIIKIIWLYLFKKFTNLFVPFVTDCNTLKPSNGLIGSRLNMHKLRLMVALNENITTKNSRT